MIKKILEPHNIHLDAFWEYDLKEAERMIRKLDADSLKKLYGSTITITDKPMFPHPVTGEPMVGDTRYYHGKPYLIILGSKPTPRILYHEVAHYIGIDDETEAMNYAKRAVESMLKKGGNPIEAVPEVEYEIPTVKIPSIEIEVEYPVANAVELLQAENPISSGFMAKLNQKWTIVFRDRISEKAVEAAKKAGLKIKYREMVKGGGHYFSEVYLPEATILDFDRAKLAFDHFAEEYSGIPKRLFPIGAPTAFPTRKITSKPSAVKEGGNPMGKIITKEEAIGMLERLSATPQEAARLLVADEAERREIMQTVQQRVKREQNKWAPMDPREGPPLPRIFAGLRWPWKK